MLRPTIILRETLVNPTPVLPPHVGAVPAPPGSRTPPWASAVCRCAGRARKRMVQSKNFHKENRILQGVSPLQSMVVSPAWRIGSPRAKNEIPERSGTYSKSIRELSQFA